MLFGVFSSPVYIPVFGLGQGYTVWFLPDFPRLFDLPYQPLTSFYNDELLLRGGPSKYNLCVALKDIIQLFWAQILQFWAMHHNGFGLPE